MKKSISLLLFVFSQSLFSSETFSQKMMMLNENLKTNSDPLPVKTRGGTMLKFDFGIYKTISAKAGWGTSKSSSKLFSSVEKSEAKQKSSIVITGSETDTAFINISINVQSEEARKMVISISRDRVAWEREDEPSKIKQTSNLVGLINTSLDTSTWSFIFVNRINTDNEKENKSTLYVTDGDITVDIRRIYKWDDEKFAVLNSIIGFEYSLNGEVLAALQSPVNTFHKKFVWLKKDLDENMKLILAAASTILLNYSNQLPY